MWKVIKAKSHTTAASEMSVVVECFPKVVDRFMSRLSTSVDQNTYFGLIEQMVVITDGWHKSKLLTSNILPIALNSQR